MIMIKDLIWNHVFFEVRVSIVLDMNFKVIGEHDVEIT